MADLRLLCQNQKDTAVRLPGQIMVKPCHSDWSTDIYSLLSEPIFPELLKKTVSLPQLCSWMRLSGSTGGATVGHQLCASGKASSCFVRGFVSEEGQVRVAVVVLLVPRDQ